MSTEAQGSHTEMWECTLCQHVYDPALGDPANGITPGTAFSDLPDDWICPECGMEKNFYQFLGLP